MRLLAYCCMPNHWHLVVWPINDGDLSEWLRWLTVTHTQRWHAHHHSAAPALFTKAASNPFPFKKTTIIWPFADTWNAMLYGPTW